MMLLLKSLFSIIFLLSTLVAERDEETKLITLNDGDFEHLTQVSTGATTGDWLILMAPQGECRQCEKIEVVLRKVAESLRGRVNIAKLDSANSRLTIRRFNTRSPTLKFFRLGFQWEYRGMMASSNIESFISEGYERQNGYRIPVQIDSFDAWQEDFVKELKSAYKEKRLPERNTLLVTLAGVFVGLIVLACILTPKKKDEDDKNTKQNNKRQSKKKR